MHVTISPIGTHGDIRPCVALAKEVQKRGHSVDMLVPENGLKLCQEQNLPAIGLEIDYDQLVKNPNKNKQDQIELVQTLIEKQFLGMEPALKKSDLLIGASVQLAGLHLAEYYDIPYYHVYFISRFLESKYYPPFRFSAKSKGLIRNWLLWKTFKIYSNKITRDHINKYRQKLGLKTVSTPSNLYRNNLLVATDAELDPSYPDIKEKYQQTGYWHLHEDELPLGLDSQTKGRKLVYLGFGSLQDQFKDATIAMIKEIASQLDVIFVVSEKLLGKKEISEQIIPIGYASHLNLFSQVDIVIHHGGAGTTHTAAYCGKPQIIIPQVNDQFYWAEKVKELGVAPNYIDIENINRQSLQERIQDILENKSFQNNAQTLGQNLRQKKSGVVEALDYLEL